jgi:alkylation response protein AidB-like acyl-CoA dehydrogenase
MSASPSDRMDFEPTAEQRAVTDAAAAFANEVASMLPADAGRFATEAQALVGARGLFAAASIQSAALVTSELARVSSALGAIYGSGWLFVDALRRYAPANSDLASIAERAAAGRLIGLAAPESPHGELGLGAEGPDATRPLGGKTPPAVILPAASHALVSARTSAGDAVVACVDLASPAVTRTPSPALGFAELPCGALEFQGLPVSARGLLGTGTGADAIRASLLHARCILTSAMAVGIARSAFEHALARVREARRPSQSTEFVVSDLATGLDAARLMTLNAAARWDESDEGSVEAHGAKLFATRTAAEICHGALRVSGAAGYDDALRAAYLDARHLELFDGTDAADIDAIAKNLLGER